MTISKGDRIPDVTLVKATPDGPEKVQSGDYFKGKKVALFSVPGAYTPTCSAKHLQGYVDKAADLKAKGVDEIACTAVNDAFVMGAWNNDAGSQDITMLADGNGDFAEALGLTMDGSGGHVQLSCAFSDEGAAGAPCERLSSEPAHSPPRRER